MPIPIPYEFNTLNTASLPDARDSSGDTLGKALPAAYLDANFASVAKVTHVGATPPDEPYNGCYWIDTSQTPPAHKVYNSGWVFIRYLPIRTVINANTTVVQFSGLNITSFPAAFRMQGIVVNAVSSTMTTNLRVNGESDSSDWAMQYIHADSNTLLCARDADSSVIMSFSALGAASFFLNINILSNGRLLANSIETRHTGTDTIILVSHSLLKNTLLSNLNSIEIVATVVNAIGIGSLFVLERLY